LIDDKKTDIDDLFQNYKIIHISNVNDDNIDNRLIEEKMDKKKLKIF